VTAHGWQWISFSLLTGCLASFGWAMRRFFVQPAGLTIGMQVIKACGVAFGILHLTAIVVTSGIHAVRGVSGTVLYPCALALFWWAIQVSLRKPLSAAFSPDLPRHLVAQGPYRMIRHPLYCSYLLCWVAGGGGHRSLVARTNRRRDARHLCSGGDGGREEVYTQSIG